MNYLAYFGAAAAITVIFLLRGTFLNRISAFQGSYPDRRVEGGAFLMVGSLVTTGWAVGVVRSDAVELVTLAGLLAAGAGFIFLAIGVSARTTVGGINKDADINGDGKIGLAEAIYIMRELAGIHHL